MVVKFGCPLEGITDDAHHWMMLYGHYKNGFLLHAGGIGDQPYRYVSAMATLDAEFAKVLRDERAKQEEAAARAAGGR
jgi:hypothetical protein